MTNRHDTTPPPKPISDSGDPRPRTSIILTELLNELGTRGLTVVELVTILRRRAYGVIFLLLGLISLLPGISIPGGVLIAWFSLQMVIGRKVPTIPRALGRINLPADRLRSGLRRVIPWLERLESHVGPRWPWLTESPMLNVLGVFMALVSVTFALPVPFTQFPPALTIILVAISMLERDGRVLAAGIGVGGLALTVGYFAIKATGRAIGLW